MTDMQRYEGPSIPRDQGSYVLASDAEAAIAAAREQAIRDAAGEAALALLAMDGVEFTPEQHNSVVEAILALQEKP